MRYVCLPLDNRPCTSCFPMQLGKACGITVEMPKDMGDKDFRAPYPFEKARDFLEKHAGNDVCLIVAVDQLCFGGLIQARSMEHVSAQEALKRLAYLHELKMRFPGMQIHAFSVIMRASISTLKGADLVHYHNMTLYSQAYHRAYASGHPDDVQVLNEIKSRIPPLLLMDYHQARDRNHEVNARCIDMALQGDLDTLMLLQEDSQPWGVHRIEQQKLVARMQGQKGNIFLHNGTDEGASLALMQSIRRQRQTQVKLAVEYLRGDDGRFTALYEDRPFCENLRSQMAYAGIARTELKDAQDVLLILSPRDDKQLDIPDDEREMDDAAALARWAQRAKNLHDQGKRLYLLDLSFANGGLKGILRAMDQAMGITNLWGYAAWNTTCNSLGTILAQVISDCLADSKNDVFLWERILDDCLYQGVIRAKLRQQLLELGEEQFCLHDWERGNRLLQGLVDEEIAREPFFGKMPFQVRANLPWPRIFEAQLICE